MAFKLTQNPLEESALFSSTQQGSTEQKKPAAKKQPAKKLAEKKPEPAPAEPLTVPPRRQSAKPKLDPDAYQRATFIVRRDLLDLLKDYAYTERREIKDVINQILEEAMKKALNEYKKDGRTLIPHP